MSFSPKDLRFNSANNPSPTPRSDFAITKSAPESDNPHLPSDILRGHRGQSQAGLDFVCQSLFFANASHKGDPKP